MVIANHKFQEFKVVVFVKDFSLVNFNATASPSPSKTRLPYAKYSSSKTRLTNWTTVNLTKCSKANSKTSMRKAHSTQSNGKDASLKR